MKRYPHVISKLFYEPMVITRARHAAICKVVEAHMARVDGMDEVDGVDSGQEEMAVVGGTMVIPVHGVLVGHASDIPLSSCGCGCDEVAGMIDIALADSNVDALVFDFRTPGGAVTGIPELGRKIAAIVTKKTIAFTDDECCSGGLWLAEQCQQFYCTESASVGSIGVWTAYLDLSKAMKKAGEKVTEVFAGKYKTMGAYWKSLNPEELAMVQASVDKIYAQFKEGVQTRREVSEEVMQGQIFDGAEAVEKGLADGVVDSIEDLI
jgi:signal peptide peptidase SppA